MSDTAALNWLLGWVLLSGAAFYRWKWMGFTCVIGIDAIATSVLLTVTT